MSLTERLTRAEQSVVMMLVQGLNDTIMQRDPELKSAFLDACCDYATTETAKRSCRRLSK
jgi:hypothetical protein